MDSRSSLLTHNGERLRWEAAEGDALIQREKCAYRVNSAKDVFISPTPS